MDMKNRVKNPWFWIGVGAIALTAIGVDPATFTSWQAVAASVVDVISNPFQLGTMILAILAVFVDPSTSGFTDKNKQEGENK